MRQVDARGIEIHPLVEGRDNDTTCERSGNASIPVKAAHVVDDALDFDEMKVSKQLLESFRKYRNSFSFGSN